MKKQKKNYRWVIQKVFGIGNIGNFVCMNNASCYTSKLSCADIFSSRKLARAEKLVLREVVRKVSLTKTGKPKKIIGRG